MSALKQTSEAVEALFSFLESNTTTKATSDDVNNLFVPRKDASEISVDVEIAFLVAPTAHRVPLYFVVPNETVSGSICLVTPPPQRTFKDKVLELSNDGDAVAKRVKRVIDTRKLAAKVSDPVTVRAISKSYNNFVIYGTSKYPKQLSGEFLAHQRIPVWIAKKGSFTDSLHRAVRTVVVSRRGANAVTCRVGHTGLTKDQIVDNVQSFVEKFIKHPQGSPLENILHIRVAGTNTEGKRAGLPIYAHKFDFSKDGDAVEAPRKRGKVEVA